MILERRCSMNYLNGLNDKQVIENRNKYGDNDIKRIKKNTFFSLLIESLSDSRKRNLLLNLRHIITSGIQEELLRIPINGSLNLFEGTF